MSARSKDLFYLFSTVVAGSLLISWVRRFGVDLIFFDEWGFTTEFIKAYVHGGLSEYDLLSLHNEHRVFTTKLWFLLSYHLHDLDRFAAFGWNVFFGISIVGVWWLILKGLNREIPLGSALVCPFLTLSALQFENWTWGFQIQWYHNIFLFLLILFILERDDWKRYVAPPLGVLCTLTISAGLLIWPLGAGLLSLRFLEKRTFPKLLLLWVLVGAVTWYLYHVGTPDRPMKVGLMFEATQEWGRTFFALLGAPISRVETAYSVWAGVFGFLLFLLYAAAFFCRFGRGYWDGKGQPPGASGHRILLCIVSYGLLSALLISLARHELGGAQYVFEASRYTALISLFWIGLLVALFDLARSNRYLRGSAYALLVCCSVSFYFSSVKSLRDWKHRHAIMLKAYQEVIRTDIELIEKSPELLQALKGIGQYSFETLQLLYTEKLSPYGFLESIPDSKREQCGPDTVGFLDEVTRIRLNAEQAFEFRGWAIHPNTPDEQAVLVLSSGDDFLGATLGAFERDDIHREVLGSPLNTGWQFRTFVEDPRSVEVRSVGSSSCRLVTGGSAFESLDSSEIPK